MKKAEELVREGKIELAIDEYLRLVEEQPGDVSAGNALGDLYAKAGNRAAAVQQFTRIGDQQRDSGFIPKAVAFYKKALKVEPGSDHALSQLAAIAVEQQLFADATLYLNRLLQRRREQHDEAGVADCLARLGGFPTATADAKLAAARASAAHVATDRAARLWIDAAEALERAGRGREAVDVLMQAAALVPDDVTLRRRVAVACAASGQIERARPFLSFETAGDHPDLLLALAEHALAEGRDADARRALECVIDVAPDRRAEADAMLAPLVAATAPAQDRPPASFELETPHGNPPSPQRGDADRGALAGGGAGAREPEPIAEPEASEQPGQSTEPEPGAPLEPPAPPEPVTDAAPVVVVDAPALVAEAEPQPGAVVEPELVEVVEPAPVAVVEPEPVPEPEVVPEPVREPVPEPVRDPVRADASEEDLDSMAALTAAAQNPALQFQASAQLGRLLLRLGRLREGIEWLEHATHASTSVREQRLDVMYELADALERSGEPAKALDVFADLDFDAASFRDVPERMAALRRGLGEGGAT